MQFSGRRGITLLRFERAKTGITTLDEILLGGFPRGSIILVAGGPGTGKTTFSAQFIYNGAIKYGEKGVYVTFTESAQTFINYMYTLSWDFERLVKEGSVEILDFLSVKEDKAIEEILDEIISTVQNLGAKRLAIDSITAMLIPIKNPAETRATVSLLHKILQKMDCTTIVTVENPWGKHLIGTGIEEFIADGIILLETVPVRNELRRRLTILKMRGTPYSLKYYQYTIGEGGIEVNPYPEIV